MDNNYILGKNALCFNWYFVDPDGKSYSLEGYDFQLKYKTGRGEKRVTTATLSSDGKALTWVMPKREQTISGTYSLELVARSFGKKAFSVYYDDAFSLFREGENNASITNAASDEEQNVYLFSSGAYNNYSPLCPTIGSNKNWYINGEDTGIATGIAEFNQAVIDWQGEDGNGGLRKQIIDEENARQAAEAQRDARYVAAETERWREFNEDFEKVDFFIDNGVYSKDFNSEVFKTSNLKDAFLTRINKLERNVKTLQSGFFYGYFKPNYLPAVTQNGYAYVGTSAPFSIYTTRNGRWVNSGCTINNVSQADEEDITSANGYLKLANREDGNGMGYVILRSGTSFSSQVSDPNTIYEVRYDFNLAGVTAEIGYNSVLKFVGGSVSGGPVNFNNTLIEGNARFTSVIPTGTIANYEIPVEWFGINRVGGLSLTGHKITFNEDMTTSVGMNITGSVRNLVIDGNHFNVNHTAAGAFITATGEAHNVIVRNFDYTGTVETEFFSSPSANVSRTDFEICNNSITTCKLGISINSDLAGESLRFNVHDNRIIMNNDSSAIGTYGIHLANCNYSKFWNNYVSGSHRHAFYHAWGHDNQIYSNTFEDNWQMTNPQGDLGVLFIARDSKNIKVYDNYFHNSKNIMLHIYAGEAEERRCTSGISNIDVFNNTFFEENSYGGFPMVKVGSNDYSGSYNTIKEQNVSIKSNVMMSSAAQVVMVRIDSGLNVAVSENEFTFGSSESSNSDAYGVIFVPHSNDRVGVVTIKSNVFDVTNRSGFIAYRYITATSNSSDKITIVDNTYIGYRLLSSLGYRIYYGMDRSNYPNIAPTAKTYYRYGEHLDTSTITDEYHEVGDIIYTYAGYDATIAGRRGRPKVGLRCVQGGAPTGVVGAATYADWWSFGENTMSNTNDDSTGTMANGDTFASNFYFSGKPGWYDGTKWIDANGFNWTLSRCGDWTARPVNASDGFCFFDFHLGKPIWRYNGAWYLADGTAAPEPAPAPGDGD